MEMENGTCTRCHRTRPIVRLFNKKNRNGKTVLRCRAKSVCSSIARRNKNPNPQKRNKVK